MQGVKQWSCNNKYCKNGNCCSLVFLRLSGLQKAMFISFKHFLADVEYIDWKWLMLHEGFIIEKMSTQQKKITLKEGIPYRIEVCPVNDANFLIVQDKCSQLLKNNKCRSYISRPIACRSVECWINSKNEVVKWMYGESLKKGDNNGKKVCEMYSVQKTANQIRVD